MKKNLSIANGTYTGQDGQQKTNWVNVGVILEKNGKEFMLINPAVNFAAFPREEGKDMVMVGIFEEQQQNVNQQYNNQTPVQYENKQGQKVNQQQYNEQYNRHS
jgi:hypothetical protein